MRIFLVALGLLLAFTSTAIGQIVYVDQSNPNCPGSGTQSDPFCSIQAGIQAAADLDTVLVAPGTYVENLDLLGKRITLTSSGGAASTVIDGNGLGPVITMQTGEGPLTVIDGFTITGGDGRNGGGVLCTNAVSPVIANNTISGNTGVLGAGVVAIYGASPLIVQNTIQGNSCLANGAGIYVRFAYPIIQGNTISGNLASKGGGMSVHYSTISVKDNLFDSNVALGSGGGLESYFASTLVEGNRFTGNTSSFDGGGMIAYGVSSPQIIGNEFTGNSASSGGALLHRGADGRVVGNTISGNSAVFDGGGVHCKSASPRLEDNVIQGNTALYGGGLFSYSSSAPIVVNTLITGNTAKRRGGGIAARNATATLVNDTIAGNTTMFGGGAIDLDYGSSFTMQNTIAWGNGTSEIGLQNASSLTATFSVVQGGYPGTGNIALDPLFVDAAGSDFRLDCASPAIDAADQNPLVPLPTLDASGLDPRFLGALDIGADEAGLIWALQGVPQVGGPPISFAARASANQTGDLAEVYLSLGDGSGGGLLVPGSGGRRLGLSPGPSFSLWLSLPPIVRQVTLAGCSPTSTAPLGIPSSVPIGLELFFAGVSWDLPSGQVVSIAETSSFLTQ
ncbi:MAG: DUF1565 domain-containing protein [Planctomycetota bacterium]